jgi:hypothetical protein
MSIFINPADQGKNEYSISIFLNHLAASKHDATVFEEKEQTGCNIGLGKKTILCLFTKLTAN